MKPIELDDLRLVDLLKAGDEAAFVRLYQKHSRLAMAVIFRITKNHDDAEDVMQETFLRVLTHIDSFDGRSKFSTWLTRIAINTTLMHLRKRRSRPEMPLEIYVNGEASLVFEATDPALDPEASCLMRNALAEVRRAVDRLPAALRETIALRCSDGAAVREIARAKGVTVSAAKSRLMRANTAVRGMLEAEVRAQAYRVRYARSMAQARD